MPSYELNLIIKRMPKAALLECCVRVGEKIIDTGSILRRIEFLGHKNLHYTLRNPHVPRSPRFKQGSFFLYHLDTSARNSVAICSDLQLDYDILSLRMLPKLEPPADYKCTLDEELQTPAYRPSVAQLIKDGEWAKNIKS